jgi:hypothetical protein
LIKNFLLTLLFFLEENKKIKKAQAPKTFISIFFAFGFLKIGAYLTGCTNQPPAVHLETLRQEAIAKNLSMMALQETERSKRAWKFTVQGQTTTGKPVQLNWSQLEALATTSITTKEPHNTTDPNAILDFRGIAVSTLLDKFGVAPNVTEVTFVARDAFRSTVSIADLRQYPIIIALARNNKRIPRSDGGPLYLVFPYTQFPQLQPKYPDRYWAFYVTDMIVGTEPINLQIGKRMFNAAALGKLPQATLEETVGYRIGWPADKVKLYGVRVRDAITAAGLTLSQNDSIIVRGKSAIYQDMANPIRLKISDINKCDILLATHWGDNRMPIPAKMGGPVTLALSSTCQAQSDDRRWVTFVEKLEIAQ